MSLQACRRWSVSPLAAVAALLAVGGAGALGGAGGAAWAQDLVINEFWTHDGSSSPPEYIELYSATGVDLTGLSVIAVDGNSANPASGSYRRLALQVDFAPGESIEPNGFYLLGSNMPAAYAVDRAFSAASVPNSTATIAIVRTQDIETCRAGVCPTVDSNELSEASLANITANLIDAIAVRDGDATDPVFFNAPTLPPNSGACWDAGARLPNGIDTESPSDWITQDNFTLVLGGPQDMLSTPGRSNEEADGACCLPGGQCTMLTSAACVALNGTFAGNHSDCGAVICSTNTAPPGCMCDVDGQAGTNVFDLLAFLDCWFEGCP